ncbi:MAG: hypothetical protein ABIY70_24650 [Capsulimonas sp.]|uniref:hypothetical protein n=1 Tax=Capsulimonas sp. TaxID=2494211 RepID=UPI003266D4C1
MMIKLFKAPDSYWEGWVHDSALTIHWGRVGEKGEAKTGRPVSGDPQPFLEQFAAEQRAEGFRDRTDEDYTDFVIQYRIDGFGSENDIGRRHEIESLMDECLGWTGNGHCDGGDIGSGSMNVFCMVFDVQAAYRTIWSELTERKWENGVTLAYAKDEDEYVVLHPEGGTFSLL